MYTFTDITLTHKNLWHKTFVKNGPNLRGLWVPCVMYPLEMCIILGVSYTLTLVNYDHGNYFKS